MNYIVEGCWAFPQTAAAVRKLGDLLSKPLPAKTAKKELYSIFGDDDLFDSLDDSEEHNDADVRSTVKRRLKKFLAMEPENLNIKADIRAGLEKLVEQLDEKVHTLKNPGIKPKGAPEDKARAFDKVHGGTGKRPDRSVLKAMSKDHSYHSIEGSNEGDYMQVLVMGGGVPEIDIGHKYHGINVMFMADGSIEKSIADDVASGQWRKDKEKILAAARKYWKAGTIEAFVKRGGDADLRGPDDFDNGFNPYSANTQHEARRGDYHGYHDKKTNEGKLSFKQFLLAEGQPDQFHDLNDYINEGRGKFGVKLGGASEEKPEVGFEDRLNYEKAKSECKEASIEFKTKSHFGIHYIIFNSEADQKKAVKLIKKVIDKSMESEW